MATAEVKMDLVTCLVCNYVTDYAQNIDWVNWYGECWNIDCKSTLFKWNFSDGSIRITDSKTDKAIDWTND